MEKYVSKVYTALAPIERVYAKLSDLTHLEGVRERVNDPGFEGAMRARIPEGEMPSEEQFRRIREGVQKMILTQDSLTAPAGSIGEVTLQVVEREKERLVKFELQGAPIAASLWVQMLPQGENTALKVTIGAELNFFIRKMVESKLKQAPDGIAQALAIIPY